MNLPCVILIGAAALTASGPARAAPGDQDPAASPSILANGTCPTAETIWAAMTLLVPHGALEALPRSAEVEVSDLGDTYRVRLVAGGVERVRVYRDVGRDCEQRARFAAVFIVLTLMPPELLIDTAPKLPPPIAAPPPPPPAPPPPVVAPPEPPPRRLRLEIGALWDYAPALRSAPAMNSLGGELRVAIGAPAVAAVIGAGLQPRTRFDLASLQARELRVPIDVGVRLRRPIGAVELGGEAGVAAAIFRAEGLNPTVPRQGTRLDLGFRAGVTLRLGRPRARIAPVAGVHAIFFPRPYDIATTPQGVLGKTPSLWIGATLGISASL